MCSLLLCSLLLLVCLAARDSVMTWRAPGGDTGAASAEHFPVASGASPSPCMLKQPCTGRCAREGASSTRQRSFVWSGGWFKFQRATAPPVAPFDVAPAGSV